MAQDVNLNPFRRANAAASFHAQSGFASAEVTADAVHAAGDVVGGRLNFVDAGGYNENGILMGLSLTDYGAVGGQVDVFLYSEAPAVIAGNAAFAEVKADALKRIAIVSIAAADWVAIGSGIKTVSKEGLSIPFVGTALYAYVVARGTPTYSADVILAVVNTFHE
jgi:hypothetical protein